MNRIESKHISQRVVSRHITTLALLAFLLPGIASAHHPNRDDHPVYPYIDVIGPIGNRLPPGYRRKYNRPTYLGGKLMHWIAPSSLEAMSWHRAVHAGAYEKPKKHLRLEQHYFFPKPWQALKIGARPDASQSEVSTDRMPNLDRVLREEEGLIEDLSTEMLEPVEAAPVGESTPMPGPTDIDLDLPDLQLQDAPDAETSSPSDI